MRVNPEELVELKNHGPMKLRNAIARAMLLLPAERSKATIVRRSEPSVLKFKAIKDLSNALSGLRRSQPRKSKIAEGSGSSRSRTRKSSGRREMRSSA